MTKATINIGTTANDRSGDNLRTAFQKVNANFTELYTALGLDNAGLNLGSFEFSGNTITTTDSSAVIIDQAVTINSDLQVDGNLRLISQNVTIPFIIDVTEPAGWVQITVDGRTAYLPYYI